MVVFPIIVGIENVFYAEPVVDVISSILSAFVYFKCMSKILDKRLDTLKIKSI